MARPLSAFFATAMQYLLLPLFVLAAALQSSSLHAQTPPVLTSITRTSSAACAPGDSATFAFVVQQGSTALDFVILKVKDSSGFSRSTLSWASSSPNSATFQISTDWLNGAYEFDSVSITDEAGRTIYYKRDGSVVSYATGFPPTGTHSLDFASADFSISGGIDKLTAPILTSITRTSSAACAPGDSATFAFVVQQGSTALDFVILKVKDSSGFSRSTLSWASSSPNSATFQISTDWLNGAYEFDSVSITDKAGRTIYYKRDGSVVSYATGFPPSGTHSLDFASADFSVSGTVVGPSITTQPFSQSVVEHTPVTFSVAATGTPTLTYLWRKAGVGIDRATSPEFTIDDVHTSDAGLYSVAVTDGTGTTTLSLGATLTVTTLPSAPEITTQPASRSVYDGSVAELTVVATGTAPLSYQWFEGVSGDTACPIKGANHYTLALPSVVEPSQYWVSVSNALGTAISSDATITLLPTIFIQQPESTASTIGSSASFGFLVRTGDTSANFGILASRDGVSASARCTTTAQAIRRIISTAGSYSEAEYTVAISDLTAADFGNYRFEITLNGLRYANTTSRIATLSMAKSFDEWAADNALTGDNALPSADPDGDRIENLTEYALGLDPSQPDGAGNLPHLRPEGSDFIYRFVRPTWATDASVAVEESTDLQTWTDATPATVLLHSQEDRQTFVYPVPTGPARAFFRLRITH